MEVLTNGEIRRSKYILLYGMISEKLKPDLEDIEKFLERENITSEECHRLKAHSPLCAAALSNSPDVLKYFISLGFDPNAPGCFERPIHAACRLNWNKQWYSDADEYKKRENHLSANNLELMRILVKDHKVDVNARDESHNEAAPLHYAAENGRLEVVKLLVEAGADPEARDNEEGFSILHFAAKSGNSDLCEYLLSIGVSVDVTAKYLGSRPLHHAALCGAVNAVKVLLDAGANVNETGKDCPSPLFCGSISGHLDVVRLLVSRGANVQADPRQHAMLINAIYDGNNDIVRYFLVEKGVCPNVTDCDQSTAFCEAMSRGNMTAAKILAACGCSFDKDDISKFQPGLENNENEIVKLLDHFQMMSDNPRKLQEICYLKIRSLLGENIVESVNTLQIPNALKNVLLLKHI